MISPDLDNLVANDKKLDVVHPLKTVLEKFKTLVLEIIEAKRTEDSGDNSLWLEVYFSWDVKLSLKLQERNLCLRSKLSLRNWSK